ncbi:Malate dehydrogenase [hydrothermal vent metagenome]|uniref:Malate dehydrogenase n=1 Tax=hydrothermal vent metagenome TaxID=652676 RepID=A0A3B1E9I9_9ZZZZ
MQNIRIGIIGVGSVGSTTAYSLSILGICHEIILFDINHDMAYGKAIDIGQSSYYSTSKNTNIRAVNNINDMKKCNVVVITAGVPRRNNMSREDLLMINAQIIKDVTLSIKKNSPDAIIICVSNPLDVMTYIIHKITKWKQERVIGMGGALDGSRMAYQINQKINYDLKQIGNLVVGDHGENMIPLPQHTTVGNIPLGKLISIEDIKHVTKKTKNGGAQIVKHLGTSGYYGPARAIVHMIEAIINDSKTIVSASVMLNGEYGYKDITIGVPIVLGSKGVESIIELDLDSKTKEKFRISINSIKNNIDILIKNNFL